jgi:hypothetical protein
MAGLTDLLLTLLLMGLLCTLQVGVGVWLGVYLANSRSSGSLRGMLTRGLERALRHEEDAKSLAAQTQRLASLCASFDGNIPLSVSQEIERLIKLTAELRDQLRATAAGYQEQLGGAKSSDRKAADSDLATSAPPASNGGKSPGASPNPAGAMLSTRELRMLTTGANAGSDDISRRYSYDAQQFFAPIVGDKLPEANEFRGVLCHDLSRGGVSIVLDEKPRYEHLIITLGTSERVFVTARIAHQRGIYSEGKLRHLIGCQFTSRLNPSPYEWDAAENRVKDAAVAVA